MVDKTGRFSATHRLRASRQFEEIYRQGAKVHRSTLVLFGRPNGLGHPRLGLTVSRKIGGSVIRNRVKRRLREIFRTRVSPCSSGIDIIVNAKRPIAQAPYLQIQQEFVNGLLSLQKRLLRMSCATEGGPQKIK